MKNPHGLLLVFTIGYYSCSVELALLGKAGASDALQEPAMQLPLSVAALGEDKEGSQGSMKELQELLEQTKQPTPRD